ncbi:hypothetical protein NO559_06605 [Dasania sp. GY-MA-18]|uniref:Uncharacterized protein n=1 Tax=Dasania phycosphaerae TaxID=2950436 RepID=A0A9J6RKY2_9GAMM|nr:MULTISPECIES: hypothetical protein [Dasania]MCR8922436.1 hypothetical protein [Dasania sp. GY-MA-18]MCZ0864864.1 hypothetical protein [Dasania phycosphaerae]MCZ0868592.1 hypothetical protein [Dasania phycosphaerae]
MVTQGEDSDSISEMAIVDLFTRLIFDADAVLDESDQLVLAILQHSDASLAAASRVDISEYLRAMDVREMIAVVASVKQQYEQQQLILLSKHYLHSPLLRH